MALAVTLVASFPIAVAAQPTPRLVMPMFVLLVTWLLASFQRRAGRRIYLLLVVQLLWVYLDTSALLGPVLVGAWLGAVHIRSGSQSKTR